MKNRENTAIPFPDEVAHLEEIGRLLEAALAGARANVRRIDKEYGEMQRYMAEYRGELDPHEMFQNQLGLGQIDGAGALAVQTRDRLEKLRGSPYFARIDFCAEGAEGAQPFYIGRFAFCPAGELLISDWRAPLAGMFYDGELGPAGYTAPAGRVEGTLTRRRQFKIAGGEMEYALESAANIRDEVLQRELSRTADEGMKSIIATIQKEQNRIIRSEKAGTMIIQGVAGSGKTSVALHRVAFLLYRQKDRLAAKNVTILSPNRVFGSYIAGVLPELGEEPIFEVSLGDIAGVQLEGVIQFEADQDPLERADPAWAARARFKSTLDFVAQMDAFIARLPESIFQPADYAFGRFTATAGDIAARFAAYGRYPIRRRLERMADDLFDRFETENIQGDEPPGRRAILKALGGMLRVKSPLALYRAFYKEMGQPKMFVMPAKKTLEWADVYPFLYLLAAFEGLQQSGLTRHLVVDEMQDYTPIQYAVLNALFPCQKTILGDFDQRVNPNQLHSLDDLRRLYDGAEFVELTQSYRSTCEIIAFAKEIQPGGRIDATLRHGQPPAITRCADRRGEVAYIARRVRDFAQAGAGALGIITKTGRQAAALYGELSEEYEVHLLSPESRRFEGGVSITPVRMAKGLEFDEVLLPFADEEGYHGEADRSLLYVACTRAMHRLEVVHSGRPSPLLPKTPAHLTSI